MLEVQLVVLADGHHGQMAGERALLVSVVVWQAGMKQVRVFRIRQRIFSIGIEGMELIALNGLAMKGTVAVTICPYSLLVAEDAQGVNLVPKHLLSIYQMSAGGRDAEGRSIIVRI